MAHINRESASFAQMVLVASRTRSKFDGRIVCPSLFFANQTQHMFTYSHIHASNCKPHTRNLASPEDEGRLSFNGLSDTSRKATTEA